MMTPQQQQQQLQHQRQQHQQHQQQQLQNNPGQIREQAPPVRHQAFAPNPASSFSEHRSLNNHLHIPTHNSQQQQLQQYPQSSEQRQQQQRSYREPPKSATFPSRRDWPGREPERGSAGERPQYPQPPKTATFPPPQLQHPPPTPSQRAHDKLDRLTAEASSYVQQISKPSPSASTNGEGASAGSPTFRQPIARVSSEGSLKSNTGQQQHQQQQQPPQRLHQLVTVQERNNTHSEPQSASSPSSATSISSAHFARNLPRTSSIDSTLSNSSNNNMHSHASSTPTASSQDVANVISAAGSPEAAIIALLKDKASAQAQNTQLWRLVDKQRAMILGLNKDLERALKDKERYRKKAKEAMFLHADHRENTESPAPSEQTESHSPHEQSTPESRHGDSLAYLGHRERNDSVDSTLVQAPATPNNVGGSEAPHHQEHQGQTPSPSAPTGSSDNRMNENRPQGSENSASSQPPRREPNNHQDQSQAQRRPMPSLNVDTAHGKSGSSRDVTPISATPLSPERVMTPRKKAPPARLELSPTEKMPFKISRGSDQDSNYEDDDDNVSVEEISGYEQRMREKELKEMKTGQTTATQLVDGPRKDSSTIGPNGPLILEKATATSDPSTQKPMTGSRPAPLQLSKLREAESVGMSPMFPPSEKESIVTQRVTVTRPMSPGLPSSPRPSPNSPLPRPRRNMSSPEPMSPRTLSPRLGLPASPRIGLMPGPFNPHGSPSTPSQATFASVGLGLVPLSPNPFTQEWPRKDSISASSPVPELLIEPSAINTIEPKVVSSRMRPSRASYMPGSHKPGGSDSVFTLGVFSKATGKELWRVEKDVGALPALDARLKHRDLTSKLPDKNLFTGHAPARVDARRAAIEEYFISVMTPPIDEKTAQALAEFFSADVVESPIVPDPQHSRDDRNSPEGSHSARSTKEGYLTKRGKNFGGWKARYFILDGPILRYFETPGGAHLGSIKLAQAQIGRQSQSKEVPKDGEQDAEAENQFRHAFLIMEPKRKDSGSLVRHVLCAENDAERDEWVDALMQWVEKRPDDKPSKAESVNSGKEKKKHRDRERERDRKESREREEEDLRAVSYEDVTAGAAPVSVPDEPRYRSPTPTSATSTSSNSILQAPSHVTPIGSTPIPDRGPPSKVISGPTNGSVISDATSWGNHTDKAHKEAKAIKKRSIWGFRGRSSSDLTGDSKVDSHNRMPQGRMVFGVSLEEAIAVSRPFGVTTPLPAVVYRCLEYLDAKNAINEEGIFRLSGSNVVIKGLRDRFNSEADVNLLATDDYYDVHAVAGLLKLYLRELPTNILTTERRDDFLHVTEMDDKQKKIRALNDLVHRLPIENFTLLKALSGHLIGIVDNASVNKMTVRNVGIVFSPTLNIPAQVFALFLQDHHAIFFRDEHEDMSPMDRPISPEQQRSPEPGRRSKPRQLSISNERPQYSQLEPPKSAALPMSPGFRPSAPAYDAPHYERPYPHYDEGKSQQAPEVSTIFQQPNALQLKMQESLQGIQQQNGQQVIVQVGRDSVDTVPSPSGMLEVKSQKARRRESSMLSVMGMGVRKSMLPPRTPQGTAGMVSEDNLYD